MQVGEDLQVALVQSETDRADWRLISYSPLAVLTGCSAGGSRKPGPCRAGDGRIQRESAFRVRCVADASRRLRSHVTTACTGWRTATRTPSSMMVKMMISGMLSCENMVGNSCSHYVGTRRLDVWNDVLDECMFIRRGVECATAQGRFHTQVDGSRRVFLLTHLQDDRTAAGRIGVLT